MNDNFHCNICWVILPSESHRNSHFKSEKHKLNENFKKNLLECISLQKFSLLCELCCLSANTKSQLDAHLNSKNHIKKITDRKYILETINNNNNNDNNDNDDDDDDDDDDFIIKNTQKKLIYSSNESISSSSSSCSFYSCSSVDETKIKKNNSLPTTKKNKNVLNNIDDFSWCTVCYVRYTSLQNRDQHLKGFSHNKRVEAKEKFKDLTDNLNYCKLCYTMTNDKSQLVRHLKSDNHERTLKQYIEFYKLINSNIDKFKDITIPFHINESGELININNGSVQTIELSDTISPALSTSSNFTVDSTKSGFIKETDVINFESKISVLNNVCINNDQFDNKWNKVLNSFNKLKDSLNILNQNI